MMAPSSRKRGCSPGACHNKTVTSKRPGSPTRTTLKGLPNSQLVLSFVGPPCKGLGSQRPLNYRGLWIQSSTAELPAGALLMAQSPQAGFGTGPYPRLLWFQK